MATQKLYRNGNSLVVSIPKEIQEELGFKEGSEVVLKKQGNKATIASKQAALASDITPEFMKTLDDFVKRHHDVLTELANK